MKLKKEVVVFVLVILGLGVLAYAKFSADHAPRTPKRGSRGGGGTVDLAELASMRAVLLTPSEAGWSATGRNIYRAPAEKTPMPPLSLPAPPRANLVASPPQPVPGPDLHNRLAVAEIIVPVAGVELPPRAEETGAGAEGEELGEDFLDDEGEGDETTDAIEGDFIPPLTADTVKVADPGQGDGKQDEREKRREKKVLGLRERLAQDAQARLEKERAKQQRLQAIEERQRTLDKIHWLSGEVWYGEVMNDAEKKEGQQGFDRYQIKIRIDELRNDAALAEADRDAALKDRELGLEFRRWTEKGFGSKQKYGAGNIKKIEFAESTTRGAYTVDAFEVARRLTPLTDVAAHLTLIDRLGEIGEWARAKEHADRLLAAGHEELAVFRALAHAARRDFDYDAEMKAVGEGLKRYADDVRLTAHLGELYSRLGLDELARRSFEKALGAEPRSVGANAGLGRHLLLGIGGGAERNVAALQYLEKAASGRFEDEERRREVLCDLGCAELAQNRPGSARRTFERVINEAPDHADALLGLAATALVEGKVAEARELLKDLLGRDPENGRGYYTMGFVAMAEGGWVEARNAFYDAMRADPLLGARAQVALGNLYEHLGLVSEAQAAYQAAYEADPEDPEVLLRQGRGFLLVGDDQQAKDFLDRALALLPNQFDVLVSLSEACFNLGQSEDALRYLDAAMALRPQSPSLLVRKAQTLVKLRRFDEAKACLESSKQLKDGDDVEVSLAYYYYLAGNHEEALKRFRTVERSLKREDERPLAAYVREYATAIADNLAKSVWVDHFDRVATGRDLLRDWRSQAPGSGINISLVGNQVQFGGTQKQSDVPSSIVQRRSGKELVSFEAALTSRADDQVVCGIGLFTFRKNSGDQNPYVDQDSDGIAYDALIFGKTREGRLAYRLVNRYELSRWEPVGEVWPKGDNGAASTLSLGIEVADAAKGTFDLLVNGVPVVSALEVKGLRRTAKDVQLWAFSQAEIDKRVDLKVDDVRIVTRED
ncbi:MAG: tetratricopeptide repeat protein [Planctomycetes bacterium]|nr:tetratricopeptide repeat protein [Planctomycetota bacterium]